MSEHEHTELPRELSLNFDPVTPESRIVVAYPKTGRTWLRFTLAHYMADIGKLGEEVTFSNVYSIVPNTLSGQVPGQPAFAYEDTIPKIEFTHETRNPDKDYPDTTIYLTRDPRDVMVSNWFHRTRQIDQYEGTLPDFVRDEDWGITSFLRHVESWAPVIEAGRMVRYESMKLNAAGELGRVCSLLGIEAHPAAIATAVSASTFERMKQAEEQTQVAGHSYDTADTNARRIREGKVGGYRKHLSEDDLYYIENQIVQAGSLATRLFSMNET